MQILSTTEFGTDIPRWKMVSVAGAEKTSRRMEASPTLIEEVDER